MKKVKLLIIGKRPPPLGGVTVHLERLIRHCEESRLEFWFYDLKSFRIFSLVKHMVQSEIIHAHVTNSHFAFLFSFLGLVLRRKTILTIHQDLHRYTMINRLLIIFSIRHVSIPIVLNKSSFIFSNRLNPNALIISSFIAPDASEYFLEDNVISEIVCLKAECKYVFCTNASNFSFDKDGAEIYGLSLLIDIFNEMSQFGLIISDPSGQNLIEYSGRFSSNIKFLNFHHSFLGVINNSDCFIRSTTTDGDSLSIKEALYLGKSVICSDCVDRPLGVKLFRTKSRIDLIRAISLVMNEASSKNSDLCGFEEMKKLYN